MPEGHTIHRLARDHSKWFGGQKMIVTSPQGRFETESKKLSGKQLAAVEAHGKHLLYHWDGKRKSDRLIVHVHLGLYGKFRLHKNPAPEPRGAVRMRMVGQTRSFDLNGPNRCEMLSKSDYEKLRSRLGQDPLREDADPTVAWERIGKSKAALGTLLLNQSIIAGIGNVYRAEILFLLGLHPERKGNSLNRQQFDEIWQLSVDLLSIGVKYNRIITVDRETAGMPLSRVTARERLLCYKKVRCTRCNSRIRKWQLGARTMFACEKCQK
jgi:endonuclease-8